MTKGFRQTPIERTLIPCNYVPPSLNNAIQLEYSESTLYYNKPPVNIGVGILL